uniref:Histidine-rich glycoprotein n=1 Tax=Anopheles dirus TaxID=7168 RepID=A0A182NP30_9DIPT
MATPAGTIITGLLLCLCVVPMLEAKSLPSDTDLYAKGAREARFFPFGVPARDHVHYYPEEHHHHHFADHHHFDFPGPHQHQDAHFHQHQHHHHHDYHDGHFDTHFF